jgi:hypothetical protein
MRADLILGNLLTPPILFFALGMLATLLRSDLEIPAAVTKALALYLLFSIGMRGGAELAAAHLSPSTFLPLGLGVAASALLPLASFRVLRHRLGAADAAAVAATYGSISAVTFATACAFLDDRGIFWSGHMVAAMALMESPAILVAVLLARRHGVVAPSTGGLPHRSLLAESFSSGPVLLLLGSFAIGAIGGAKGWASVEPFAHAPFKGVLCLFLLDMGLVAARRLSDLRRAGGVVLAYALLAPLAHATLGIGVSRLAGLPTGDALLLTVLFASASYIAVPAAMRMLVPQSNPGIYLPMALAVTFPLNIALGIPLYLALIERLWPGA